MIERHKLITLTIAFITGLTIHGFFIGSALQRFKKEDRSISVKGFSEKEVKANFAVWTINTRVTSNDLNQGSKEIETNKSKIIDFLLNNGISKNEIIQQDLNVTDKLARDFDNGDVGQYRYIIENSIQVRSEKVDIIQLVSRMTDQLLKAGIVISSNNYVYNPAVKYLFTKLNDIKPSMLSEATQNAKQAAIEFTRQSNTKLGGLKKASQGLFSIIDRDAFNTSQSEGGYFPTSVNDMYKKIKVIVNVEYSIE
jgi:hypothetical protein